MNPGERREMTGKVERREAKHRWHRTPTTTTLLLKSSSSRHKYTTRTN